ncbi:MAG: hypothetical protein HYW25_04245 [Candidatus Aenigmarchaeota archaeon]|nr:hypothetical protein [Candidatus Aenigmarchaeota archaeon]
MICIIDSNFLLVPYQFKVDVINEIKSLGFQPLLLSCVVEELRSISGNKGKAGSAAKIALELIEKKKLRIEKAECPADAAILNYSVMNKCAVATNDVRLIRKLKSNGIKVIRLRQKKLVVVE